MLMVGAVVMLSVGAFHQGFAQEKFPSKPITIIVSWAPGGGMDLNTRALQPLLEKILGQPVVIINKSGGGGTIGFTEGAKASPDGHTITLLSPSILTTTYMISSDIHYRNYSPVIRTGYSPSTMTVKADAPWQSLHEFLKYAKANPEKIRMADGGHGSASHIRGVWIELITGVKFTHIPFKGTAPALMALAGGHAEGFAGGVTDEYHLVKGGKLRILAITAPERMALIPEVPTFQELGIDFDSSTWHMYVVPKGTPQTSIKVLHDAFKKAMDSAEFADYAKNQAVTPGYLGPEACVRFLKKEDKIWLKMIEAAGLRQTK